MNHYKHKKQWIVACTVLLLLGVTAVALWWNGAFLAAWHEKEAQADVNADNSKDALLLQNRTLQITTTDGILLWQSEDGWLVEDFLLGDINHDGSEELLLLVWKRGSFGEKRPFWVEKDEVHYSQHIFIYSLQDGMHSIWMSSRLRPQVKAWAMGTDETIAITTPEGEDTRWGWVGWGLQRLDGGAVVV